jgi:hypothetical protein
MSWNESGNGKDPWKRNDDEPNDLDQIVQNWQKRLSAILGGGGGGGGGRGGTGSGGGYFLLILLVGAWLVTGF